MIYGKPPDHGLMCDDDGILLCSGWLILPLVSLAGWIRDGILYNLWEVDYLVWRSCG